MRLFWQLRFWFVYLRCFSVFFFLFLTCVAFLLYLGFWSALIDWFLFFFFCPGRIGICSLYFHGKSLSLLHPVNFPLLFLRDLATFASYFSLWTIDPKPFSWWNLSSRLGSIYHGWVPWESSRGGERCWSCLPRAQLQIWHSALIPPHRNNPP